ncbi:MAG: hypothetical protein K2X46_19945 [Roseomonas sp.]|nr:hypothetical protein [Roseomonas sp.]
MKKPAAVSEATQLVLPLTIEKEVEIDGIGMGVLSDGTPFLTGRGLARMCGVDHMLIIRMTAGWSGADVRPRERKIKETLKQQGVELERPFIPIPVDGVMHNAYPDLVCMAVLEYYAFDAGQTDNKTALANYRMLARKSFRDFIYNKVGYDQYAGVPEIWRQFHDRVSLSFDTVPLGYFSVFKEMSDIIVTLIRNGAKVGAHFVPDGSVGIHWSNHWKNNKLEDLYGARKKYPHYYPEYFPQAPSNPQGAHCYPDAALGEFRRWIWAEYLPAKFPNYLSLKVGQGILPAAFAEAAIKAIEQRKPKSIG